MEIRRSGRGTTRFRTIVALAAVTLTATAAGCGSEEEGAASSAVAAAAEGASSAVSEATATSEGDATATTAGSGRIAVLLPDSASSSRWETDDRKYFDAAFKAAGVEYEIQNAEGDPATQQQQAESAITNGATVLLLVNLDSGSGAEIEKNAKAKGVKVIDYDRLTLNGEADYYVSFDNTEVGKLQGQGLVDCLTAANVQKPKIVQLHGSPDDNNATLFREGYQSVLNPKFDAGEYEKAGDQAVPAWDNQQALTIFEGLLQAAGNKVDGVLAANDGLGNAAIQALKAQSLKVPVTGQDATAEGIQNILAGDQCMTVYKPIKAEADAAAAAAIAVAKGETPEGVTGEADAESKQVPAILLTPVAVTKDNIADTVIKDGFRTWEEICTGDFAQYCPPEATQ